MDRLTISDPNDRFEQEAEKVATAIVGPAEDGPIVGLAPESLENQNQTTGIVHDSIDPLWSAQVQREGAGCSKHMASGKRLTCAECTKDIKRKPKTTIDQITDKSTIKDDDGRGAERTVAAEIDEARGNGRQLPVQTRQALEPRFGYDFGHVQIHTDERADKLARKINARAFTIGRDVFFASGEYRPGTITGRRLLAHELTHVVQQTRPFDVASEVVPRKVSFPRDPTEREARKAEATVQDPKQVTIERSVQSGTVQRYGFGDLTSDIGAVVTSAASNAYEAGESAVREGIEGATELASGVVERSEAFVEQSIETVGGVGRALVNRIAPGLIPFLTNPGDRIENLLTSGLDSFMTGALDVISPDDVKIFARLERVFLNTTETVKNVVSQLGTGIDGALGATLRPFVSDVEQVSLPLLSEVQDLLATVQGAVQSVVGTIDQPISSFVQSVGGDVWKGIIEVASWAWKLAAPLRSYAEEAWNWLQTRFRISWESQEGVRNWILDAASEVWNSILSSINPVVQNLKSAGEALSMVASFQPIVKLTKDIESLWGTLQWVTRNWNTRDVLVRAREVLRERILPGVLDGVSKVTDLIGRARTWLVNRFGKVSSAFKSMIGAVREVSILSALTNAAATIQRRMDRLASWAGSTFDSILGWISTALTSLGSQLKPVLDFLTQLSQVLTLPLRLPTVITGALWRRLPDQFKPPIITFLFDVLLKFVRGFPAFASPLGPLSILVKQAVIGFLERMRDTSADVKVSVSNRIANLLQGSMEFSQGYLWGMLRGIWEGLTDPFRIIYLLGQVAVGASRFLARHVGRLFADEKSDGARINRARETLQQAATKTEGAGREIQSSADRASSQPNATPQGIFEMLQSVWNSVLQKSQQIGGSIAQALLDFIRLPDFELGNKLGWVGGTVLFEVVLYALTAGAWAGVTASRPILRGILRFIDLGGELVGAVAKGIAKLKGPVMSALGKIGDLVRLVPGLARVWDDVADALRSLFRISDEAGPAARGAGEVTESAGTRSGQEGAVSVGETTGPSRPPGGRAAAESAEFRQWRDSVTGETRDFLRRNPEIRERYAEMPPDTRDLLTYCASVCVIENIDDISRRQIGEVTAMLRRLGGADAIGDDVMVKLQMYFHTLSGDMDWAVRILRQVDTVDDLNRKLLQAFRRRIQMGGPMRAVDPDAARRSPGIVTGGERLPPLPEGSRWLAYTQEGAALPPRRIADRLRGREFKSWGDFKQAFWEEVGRDTELPIEMGPGNIGNIEVGKAPAPVQEQQWGARIKLELHHIEPIEQGGGVYDLSNIAIVSPRTHELIHHILPGTDVML